MNVTVVYMCDLSALRFPRLMRNRLKSHQSPASPAREGLVCVVLVGPGVASSRMRIRGSWQAMMRVDACLVCSSCGGHAVLGRAR